MFFDGLSWCTCSSIVLCWFQAALMSVTLSSSQDCTVCHYNAYMLYMILNILDLKAETNENQIKDLTEECVPESFPAKPTRAWESRNAFWRHRNPSLSELITSGPRSWLVRRLSLPKKWCATISLSWAWGKQGRHSWGRKRWPVSSLSSVEHRNTL